MAEGCPEQLPPLDFLRFVWTYPTRSRPKVLRLLAEHGAGRRIVHLRTRAEVAEFLARLPDAHEGEN
jgi:hypothetical protein